MFFNKKITIFLVVLILIFCFFILANYLSFSFIFTDDTDTAICSSIKYIFKNPTNALYVPSTYDRLFTTLFPMWFNIHPSFFKSHYYNIVETILILYFAYILNSIMYRKLDILYPISFIFSFSLIFKFIIPQPYMLFSYDGFSRMLISVFLFITLFFFLNNEKRNNLIIIILTILCCFSSEMVCTIVFVGYLLFVILSKKKIKDLITNSPSLILFLIISAFELIVLFKLGAFSRKMQNFDMNYLYFLSLLKNLPDYLKVYFQYIVLNHIYMFIFLAVQTCILCLKFPKDENIKTTIKLIILYLIGLFLFFFALIGLGKTHFNENQYWVVHKDLHVMLDLFLCTFNFALFNYFIEYKFIKKSFISIILIIASGFFICCDYVFYKNFLNDKIIPLRAMLYKSEKIIRYAEKNNEIAYLDKNLYSHNNCWSFFSSIDQVEENVLYLTSPHIIFLNQFEKDKFTKGFIFTDEKTVNEKFKQNGGSFSEEELRNINFKNLKDI